MNFLNSLPATELTLHELNARSFPVSSATPGTPNPAPLCECGHEKKGHSGHFGCEWAGRDFAVCLCDSYRPALSDYDRGYRDGHAKAIETVRARLATVMEGR